MSIRELANHPGMTLRDDAAIQLDLLEKDHGVITINRAGVSEAEQQKLIDRWNQGGKYNRPPFLYEPKRPPKASDHVQQIAVDTSSITHMLKYGDAYGFYRNYEWDKPHFVFDPRRVRIRPPVTSVESEAMNGIEQLVAINEKVYGIGFGKIKHLSPSQLTDVRNTTGIKLTTLTDNRRNEAWGNLVDYYGIEPGVLDNDGFVYDPFAKRHVSGGLWSEDRATRAELRELVKSLTK